MSVRVLGVDPGFASIGFAILEVHRDREELVRAGVFRTEKSSKKQNVLASDDNVRRGREITEILREIFNESEPTRIRAVCAESMSFPRNSSAAAKVALCWGILTALLQVHQLPLIQASPQEVKRFVCGKRDASKEEVAAAVRTRLPEVGRVIMVPKTQQEHAYDACAVALTCLNSDIGRTIRNLA